MWPCAIFNLRDIRLADWLSQFLLDGAHQFQLRHGPTEAAQRAFDFSQVTKFLRQTHSLPLTHIAITILLFAISVKKGMCREISRLRGHFLWSYSPASMRERGSSKSRNASPMKLKDRTASITASAGKTTRWAASNRCARLSFSIAPQLAVGGGTPRPRKLIVASARIAPAMPIAACTMTG